MFVIFFLDFTTLHFYIFWVVINHQTDLDKVTPFLFLIVAKRLARRVRQAKNLHVLKGIKIRKKEIVINLLQFEYDTLFIC